MRPKTAKVSQKKGVARVDWEREYEKQVRNKTKEVKEDILDTCDKIENG